MNASSKILKGTVICFFVLGYGLAYLLTSHASFIGSKSLEIEKGDGSRIIAEKLKKNGFIQSKWAFIFYLTITGKANNLKPGNFIFSSKSTIPQIARELAYRGTEEKVVTIPEGWSIEDIADYFSADLFVEAPAQAEGGSASGGEKRVILAPFDFYAIAKSKNSEVRQRLITIFPFLKEVPAPSGLEGYLFPDTYRVYKNASAEDIIIKMLKNFERKISPELQLEIARQKKSVFEIITMASMIEKEVVSDEDRILVSGILWKRLELGIGLNVDATIVFAKIQNSKLKVNNFDKISIEDTKIESPYNTYKYRGLPFGPISNPGLSAIMAAIYPKKSDYLYYLSKPDGTTVFSRTLEEHNIAKAKYLK